MLHMTLFKDRNCVVADVVIVTLALISCCLTSKDLHFTENNYNPGNACKVTV